MSQEMNQTELDNLKARATLLGVQFHPSIGVEKLREKVTAAMNNTDTDDEAPKAAAVEAKQAVESEGQKRKRLRAEANELIRIRITCMNPAKKDWNGEIITVGNKAVGTMRKYIPFVCDEGWHVPRFIYEVLKDRQCQVFVTSKTKNGVSIRQSKLIKEFAIEVLPQLSAKELHDLAQRQAMAKSID